MAASLSPAKLVLLAVHSAVNADIASLTTLAAHHTTVLRKDLVLRILLTYLPETLPSSHYIDLLQQLETGAFPVTTNHDVDCSPVEGLAEDEAAKKVRKLRLLPLGSPEAPSDASEDLVTQFLLRRSYKVDEEAGLLDELPALLLPFLDHSPCIRSLLVSTILPLLRRNCEYYPCEPIPYTLLEFHDLPDKVAVNLLLSQTGAREADLPLVGRDLRSLVGPWLSGERRWKHAKHATGPAEDAPSSERPEDICPGWDEVLRWLAAQASKNWKVAVNAIQQWDGPGDVDLGGWGAVELDDSQRQQLEQSYSRAALASAYFIPDASVDALDGAYSIVARVAKLQSLEPVSPLASALAVLPPLTEQIPEEFMSARNATHMRNNVLDPSNILTSPTDASVSFLQALILSAHILTKAGCPCTIRRAAELALLRDEREQKAEAAKLIHTMNNNGPKTDDKFWVKARNDILWLRDWGAEDGWSSDAVPRGVFSQVKREFLEVELLKALLSNTRYDLARSIYEDAPDRPLDSKMLQDTIYVTAMTAFDNASNPNRTRGGLKKCDDIIKAFPKTIQKSDPHAKRIEALLQATHSLSDYRLVLKQGEPFTPVVLRVHSDPISIVGKILEQNPKSYTQLHDLLDLGSRMVDAGLTAYNKSTPLTLDEATAHHLTAKRRITAMCIDAALTEDDFETAYSYVITRLSSPTPPNPTISITLPPDDYSWKAALQAGKHRLFTHPTHLRQSHHTHKHSHSHGLGTTRTSANPEIRHLEQRIECLATALRVAPPPTLQEIINAFRRAEEELDVKVREEEEREEEWDAKGDAIAVRGMPGGFAPGPAKAAGAGPSGGVNSHLAGGRRRSTAADEDAAPMSLFDLSRASVLSAQRNLSALSGLQRSAGFGRLARVASGGAGGGGGNNTGGGEAGGRSSMDQPPLSVAGSATSAGSADEDGTGNKRVRKRDQLREAALGSLVSGVGWLVGAPPPTQGHSGRD
ncbi:hypothetical protein VTI74DRAFT_111 [Chaetomium olivicolor]